MNFDSDFGNIYDRLYNSHKELMRYSEYEVFSNKNFEKKCKDNYNSVMRFLRNITERNFYSIFDDALIFADSINNNKQLIEELWGKNKITRLVFGLSQIDIVNQICTIGRNKGQKYINIEHWTILIYFYFTIKTLAPQYYEFPSNNLFLTILNIGDKSNTVLLPQKEEVNEKLLFNGFTTYYRMLFSTAIFSKGKALDFELLGNSANLDLDKIKGFLMEFKSLCSLNYDNIMESIVDNPVDHFHGEFVKDRKEYVYSQSLRLKYDKAYVSFSDLMIGDYFTFKTLIPAINHLSKGNINKETLTFSRRMDDLIEKSSVNSFVIFGMNIENDQHVLRNLMLSFYNANQKKPHIIYCYFNSEEKEEFIKQFSAVITFSQEVSAYAHKIEVSYIRTQDILKEYFYKG
ncbi:hypothetical protein [Paenibacillus sp. NPDC057967]|uniref:hypothetical protein n=1 Tax=Paenibacillus sp. NPDC057967 TaxID=3346293 RepID=UPI0036DD5C9F